MPRSPAAIAITLLAIGCGRPAAPEGTYRLVADRAGNLPVLLKTDTCHHMLMSGEVRITGDDRFSSNYSVEIACPGHGIEHFPMTGEGSIRADGDSLIFEDDKGGLVGHGNVHGDTLAVAGPLHLLYYVRR